MNIELYAMRLPDISVPDAVPDYISVQKERSSETKTVCKWHMVACSLLIHGLAASTTCNGEKIPLSQHRLPVFR